MIHWLCAHGYNISLVNSLEFRDTKVRISFWTRILGKSDGCVIVQNFTTLDVLEEARREVEPWLGKENENSQVGGESSV